MRASTRRRGERVRVSDLAVALDAVIVAVSGDEPRVLVRLPDDALPAGPFEPDADRTLEAGVRRWVTEQTRLGLGHVEQLYTFGDRDRAGGERDVRLLSIAYLAFVRETAPRGSADAEWRSWYRYFPWEDWRDGRPAIVDDAIVPAVEAWVRVARGDGAERERRARRCIGMRRGTWNAELALERYELFWEIGLVAESRTPGPVTLGEPMAGDHRRIVATAIGRVRGALRYRPLVFELLPATFTLTRLQRTVEALSGVRVHAPNFRRLVATARLVEETGERVRDGAGRPATRYRFRPDVVREREAPGVGVPKLLSS